MNAGGNYKLTVVVTLLVSRIKSSYMLETLSMYEYSTLFAWVSDNLVLQTISRKDS